MSIIPAAFKIEYGESKNPDIIVRFGKIFNAEEIAEDFDCFKRAFTENINSMKTNFNFSDKTNLFN